MIQRTNRDKFLFLKACSAPPPQSLTPYCCRPIATSPNTASGKGKQPAFLTSFETKIEQPVQETPRGVTHAANVFLVLATDTNKLSPPPRRPRERSAAMTKPKATPQHINFKRHCRRVAHLGEHPAGTPFPVTGEKTARCFGCNQLGASERANDRTNRPDRPLGPITAGQNNHPRPRRCRSALESNLHVLLLEDCRYRRPRGEPHHVRVGEGLALLGGAAGALREGRVERRGRLNLLMPKTNTRRKKRFVAGGRGPGGRG